MNDGRLERERPPAKRARTDRTTDAINSLTTASASTSFGSYNRISHSNSNNSTNAVASEKHNGDNDNAKITKIFNALNTSTKRMQKEHAENTLDITPNGSVGSKWDNLNLTPNNVLSKRVSLNRTIRPFRPTLPLSKFAAKEDTATDIPHDNDRPVALTQKEYNNNLKSLHEIISKSFDPKMAFNYNFINIMNTFINNDKGHVDFKLIALSLEAGTKVWASKVDVVFRNTQKVSNSLSMATDDKGQPGDDDDDNGLFDQSFNRNEKRKRIRKKKNVSTTVSNIDTINGKYETNIEVDPLFHHFSAAFDVGDVNSLLMANLTRNPMGALLLDSNEKLNFSSFECIPSVSTSFPALNIQENPFSTSRMVCPGVDGLNIRDFAFNDRAIGTDIVASQQEEFKEPFVFNIDAEVEDVDLGNISDDDFAGGDANSDDHNIEDGLDRSMFGGNNLMAILPQNDNQFFDKNFLKKVFRKMSFFKKPRFILSSSDASKPKQRKRRATHAENDYDLDGIEQQFETKDSYKFTPATLNKWISNSENFHIKDDYGFTNDQLRACFSKPHTYFQDLLKDSQFKEQETNQFANDGRSNVYEDEGIKHDDDFSIDFDEQSSPESYNLNLPDEKNDDEPVHIDALDIDYARVAKKIDIKRVKKGMWDIIRDSTDTHSMFSQTQSTQESTASSAKGGLTFSSLRQILPDRINTNLNDNLSVPISFVALLHLCNDKDLELSSIQQDQLSDFVIQMSHSHLPPPDV